MTNPWAVIPFTFDGSSLQTDDFTIYFWIVSGLFEVPQVRGEDTVVPALAGRVEGNRVNDVLTIVLEGQITASPLLTDLDDTRSDWWDNVAAIRTLFASDRERADLVAQLPNGTTATISAHPMNIVKLEEIPGEYVKLNVELEGFDDWLIAGS